MRNLELAIEAHGICKSFGTTRALDNVDLEADSGRVLALLGPNGSGKTTLVRILATLLRADAGSAQVLGHDVTDDAAGVRSVIGLSGQFAAIDDLLTGRENLVMVGELYHLSPGEARTRAAGLLSQFALTEAADRRTHTYSGGMRRRLDLAASLVARPAVLVLDEPTTGLDPGTRLDMWVAIEALVEDGTTVLLTTQYPEDADRLADRIVVLDRGKIIARGTTDELKSQVGGAIVELSLPDPTEVDRAVAALASVGTVLEADRERGWVSIPAPDGLETLRAVMGHIERSGVHVEDIGVRRPSLDDVFLALTGYRPALSNGSSAKLST
jgi:ABC-2 type transport system ATP-binding protein